MHHLKNNLQSDESIKQRTVADLLCPWIHEVLFLNVIYPCPGTFRQMMINLSVGKYSFPDLNTLF